MKLSLLYEKYDKFVSQIHDKAVDWAKKNPTSHKYDHLVDKLASDAEKASKDSFVDKSKKRANSLASSLALVISKHTGLSTSYLLSDKIKPVILFILNHDAYWDKSYPGVTNRSEVPKYYDDKNRIIKKLKNAMEIMLPNVHTDSTEKYSDYRPLLDVVGKTITEYDPQFNLHNNGVDYENDYYDYHDDPDYPDYPDSYNDNYEYHYPYDLESLLAIELEEYGDDDDEFKHKRSKGKRSKGNDRKKSKVNYKNYEEDEEDEEDDL